MLARLRITAMVVALCLCLPATADETSQLDQLMVDIEKQLHLSQEKIARMQPELRAALEEKNKQLSSSFDSALDQGLTELSKLQEEYAEVSEASSEKLREFLESDELMQLKDYLSGLDKEALEQARDQLVADFMEALELTAEQIKAIRPLLEEKMARLSEILRQYMDKGRDDFEQFRVQFEAERQRDRTEIEAILDDSQTEKMQQQFEAIKQAINAEVFDV